MTWPNLKQLKTSRAAWFWTFWSFSMRYFWELAIRALQYSKRDRTKTQKGFNGSIREKVTNRGKTVNLQVAQKAGIGNMLAKWEGLAKCDTKIANRGGYDDWAAIEIDWRTDRQNGVYWELIRIISVWSSLSFSCLHSSRILTERCMTEWTTLSRKLQRWAL